VKLPSLGATILFLMRMLPKVPRIITRVAAAGAIGVEVLLFYPLPMRYRPAGYWEAMAPAGEM